jgi:hypothetical protein
MMVEDDATITTHGTPSSALLDEDGPARLRRTSGTEGVGAIQFLDADGHVVGRVRA